MSGLKIKSVERVLAHILMMVLVFGVIGLSVSEAHAQYNDAAGQNAVNDEGFKDPVKLDRHGNLAGSDFDLAMDGAFDGQTIVVLQLFTGSGFRFDAASRALKKKGFTVELYTQVIDANRLKKALSTANQLWVISSFHQLLDETHLKVISDFFDAGHGVYLWGDNKPYYMDANFLSKPMLGTTMSGDVPGGQIVSLKRSGQRSGILSSHLLSTGLQSLYEGNTVATVRPGKHTRPFLWGSAGNIIAAYYDYEGKRAILDGGYTRLMAEFIGRAGTERYVVNAAAWLANVERFGDAVVAKEFRKPLKITFDQAQIDMGKMVPGQVVKRTVHVNGEFEKQDVKITLENRANLPSCLSVLVDGKKPGEPFETAPGDSFELTLSASSYCGADVDREFEGRLKVSFASKKSQRLSRALNMPFLVHMTARVIVEIPQDIEARVGEGAHLFYATIKSNAIVASTFTLKTGSASKDGHMEFVALDAEDREMSQGKRTLVVEVPSQNTRKDVRLGVRAASCCASGTHKQVIVLTSVEGTGSPVAVPVVIEARGEDFWGCWLDRILMALAVLCALLVLAYGANMWRQSHFLRRKLVMASLMPLRWDEWGEPQAQDRQQAEVKRMVRKSLSFGARLKSWLKANPFKIGWPGNAYYETAQLYLEPSRDVSRSRLALLSERDFLKSLRSNPQLGLGKAYVSARGGLSFVAVPDRQSRVGRLEYHNEFGMVFGDAMEEDLYEVVRLRKDNLLDIASDREADMGAGWRVG